MCPLTHQEMGGLLFFLLFFFSSPIPLPALGRTGNSLARNCSAQTQLLRQERHGGTSCTPQAGLARPSAPKEEQPEPGKSFIISGMEQQKRPGLEHAGFCGVLWGFYSPASKETPKEGGWVWVMLSCSAQTLPKGSSSQVIVLKARGTQSSEPAALAAFPARGKALG